MASKFTWIPVFKAVASWLVDYENRQPELVGILKEVGIDAGLDDKDETGNTILLQEIDPFTFFCMFTKYGIEKRKQLFAKLVQVAELSVPPPSDFDGVPSANAMKVWMFPFKASRQDWMIPTLWKLFKQSKGELDPDTFSRALQVPGTGFAKLTEALFYVDPDRFFPIDAQTRPWLEEVDVSIPTKSLIAYQSALVDVRKHSSKPFAELSLDAWAKNQKKTFDTKMARGYLEDRYPDVCSSTKYIAAFQTQEGRQLALSANLKTEVKLFIDSRPPQIPGARVEDYPPGRSRNSNLDIAAQKLGVGHQAYYVQLASMDELVQLCDWYESKSAEQSLPSLKPLPVMTNQPLNQILYGPPGTGKTFATIDKALAILVPDFAREHAGNRAALKARYDELVAEHRIRFVTFHQSFSYEDFVEGLRADSEGGTLQYRVEPGVFRSICDDARGSAQVASDIGVREDARIWKISIDGTVVPSQTRNYCFANGEARIGWSAVGDLKSEHLVEGAAYASLGTNDRSSLRDFSQEIEPGDVLLCIGSEDQFQAVGVVQGGYEYQAAPPVGVRPDYVNVLPVHWLAKDLSLDIRPINGGRKFTLKTVYELGRFGWPELADYLEASAVKLDGAAPVQQPKGLPHVLIIDEINRGNISRVFGELITLIEPSKRKGTSEALEVVLPYSKKKFSVPNNVYLVGTMNTADRSLAGLDIALRRRFKFEEMPPQPKALASRNIDGIDLQVLLTTMNRRIEVLLGRDYLLGHAYFLEIQDLAGLADVFRRQVLPLLQEYFFEDWQRIAWVLNDQAKPDDDHKFLIKEVASLGHVFGPGVDLPQGNDLWRINDNAFDKPESYAGILNAG
ncbi:AAA family ATPase [Pseudoxanthomonas sp. LjRoot125]